MYIQTGEYDTAALLRLAIQSAKGAMGIEPAYPVTILIVKAMGELMRLQRSDTAQRAAEERTHA